MNRWKQMTRALVLSAVTAIPLAAQARPVTRLPGVVKPPSGVAAEAGAGEDMLLVYNSATRVGSTARLGPDGSVLHLRTFGLDGGWSQIVPTTNGRVLFYNVNTGDGATGQFQADGSFQDLQSYPRFFGFSSITSTSDGILLIYTFSNDFVRTGGDVQTGRLDANGNYIRLQSYQHFDPWTHIVPSHDGLVFFYSAYTGKAATGRVQADGSYQDLRFYEHFDKWTQIIATTDGTLLFYNTTTGAAATGRLDAGGNYSDLRFFDLAPAKRLVPTTKGRFLILGLDGVLVAQIDAQGSLIGGLRVPGLATARGLPIVFVR
jgi:hypothetical protein